jgi:hypothetical protein
MRPLHPSVLRLIRLVRRAATRTGFRSRFAVVASDPVGLLVRLG